MDHRCHAHGCKMPCKPEFLMCARHWYKVPRALQSLVYRYYRNGQCDDMKPSPQWYRAADAAINYVALLEGLWPMGRRYRCPACMVLPKEEYVYGPEPLGPTKGCPHNKLRTARRK